MVVLPLKCMLSTLLFCYHHLLLLLLLLLHYMFVWCMCHNTHTEVRELCEAHFLRSLSGGFLELNSGNQVCTASAFTRWAITLDCFTLRVQSNEGPKWKKFPSAKDIKQSVAEATLCVRVFPLRTHKAWPWYLTWRKMYLRTLKSIYSDFLSQSL